MWHNVRDIMSVVYCMWRNVCDIFVNALTVRNISKQLKLPTNPFNRVKSVHLFVSCTCELSDSKHLCMIKITGLNVKIHCRGNQPRC